MTKKIMLSGIKPTGRPHLGNYFGMMRQLVALQNDYQVLAMIADYHALTITPAAKVLNQDILDLAIDYLAVGLDSQKVILFKQSDVSEHTELAWIFNCLTTVPYLQRAHAYKDARTKNQEVSVGTFDYPLLMAADILLYDTDLVPIGQDQKQHLEIARNTAEKFNRLYDDTFKLPAPHILPEVKIVPGIDGQKMSKSYHNAIPLFATETEIRELVMKIKTDSKGVSEPKNPDEDTVFALHRLVSAKYLPLLEKRYREGGIGYQESKEILIANLNSFAAPLRERRGAVAQDRAAILKILQNGASAARERARLKMTEVRRKIGVSF